MIVHDHTYLMKEIFFKLRIGGQFIVVTIRVTTRKRIVVVKSKYFRSL